MNNEISNEQRLIAIMMKAPDIIFDYEYIGSSNIFNELNKSIFEAIIKMRENDEFVNTNTLKQYIKNNDNYLEFLNNIEVDTREFDSVCKQQVNITVDFRLTKLNQEILNARSNSDINGTQKIEEIERSFGEFLTSSEGKDDDLINFKDAFKDFLSDLSSDRKSKPCFGSSLLNEYCPTANEAGEVVIVGARPGIGKTLFMQSLYINAVIKDEKIAIFSTEMPINQLISRLLSDLLNVDSKDIHSGKITASEIKDKLRQNENASYIMKKISENAFIYDKEVSVEEIRQKARMLKRKNGLDIVIVDYLQRVKTFKKFQGGQETQKISYISSELKSIAKKMEVAMYCLTQLNRNCEERVNKRPITSDLKQSGDIEQDASIIIMLYRDEVYNKDSEIKGYIECNITKNRHGKSDNVVMKAELEYSRLVDISKEENDRVNKKIIELTSKKKK